MVKYTTRSPDLPWGVAALVAVAVVVAVLLVAVAVVAMGTGVSPVGPGAIDGAVAQTDPVAGNDWPSVRGGPALMGANPGAPGPAGDVGPTWIVRTGATGGGPVVSDGTLYTGNRHGDLIALDAASGSVEWQTELSGGVWTAPAVTDTHVLAVYGGWEMEDTVVAIDRETGAIEWEYELDFDVTESPIVADDGTVAIAGTDNGQRVILGVDPTPPEGDWPDLWRVTHEGQAGLPVVTDDAVYSLGGEQRTHEDPTVLHAFDRETEELLWTQSVDRYTRHLLLADGTLYTHTSERLYAIDPDSGEIHEEYDIDVHYDTPMAYADGTLYYPTSTGYEDPAGVAAFDTDAGEVVWTEWSVDDPRSPPTVGSEHVYISDSDAIYAIDRESGTLAWQHRPGDPYGGTDNELAVVGDTLYATHMVRTTQALQEGGDAREGGVVDLVRWLRDNAELGMTSFGAVGGLLGGLVAAGLTWGLIRLGNYSRLPPTIFAGKLRRRPIAAVSGRDAVFAHFLAGVLLSTVFGALFLGLQLGLPRLFGPLGGVAGPLLVGALFLWPPVFAVLAIGGPWAVIAYRWLPAHETALDRPADRIKREWAIVHVVFAFVAVPIYGIVTFLLGMLVFFV